MITYPRSWRSGTCPNYYDNENRRTVLQSCKYKARIRSSTKSISNNTVLTRKSVTVERHNYLMMSMLYDDTLSLYDAYDTLSLLCHYMMILC